MAGLTNRTFDEIAVGATEAATRTLAATDVEALALGSGDVDAAHLEGGELRGGASAPSRKARRPSRWSRDC